MNSGAGDTTQLVPGFPIRTPWDHSSVDSSPRPIAASHVLHRLLVPRHSPTALSNLTKRCSRPLYNSQPTHQPHTNPPPAPTPWHRLTACRPVTHPEQPTRDPPEK